MKQTLFLYSGEGTSHAASQYTLLKFSRRWPEIERILKSKLDLDLQTLWSEEIGSHQCPHSPLLTLVTQVCLADLWSEWGYAPNAVIGHSIGELAAAFQAGLYSLEEILLLTHQIGTITAKLDGAMSHGVLSDAQISNLPIHISSFNFMVGDKKHVTVSGPTEQIERFIQSFPDFTKMRLPHPWHHPDYGRFIGQLKTEPSRHAKDVAFISGVTQRFETQLDADYWRNWMTHRVDFISAMSRIKERYGADELSIVEIGFHPVLDKCCAVFDRYRYASSMFRGEDAFSWILHQRRRLDQEPFTDTVKSRVHAFNDRLDLSKALSYQGLTSIAFVELAKHLETLFPSLAPQDFYRYKSIDQLIRGFGSQAGDETSAFRSKVGDNQVVIAAMSCRFPAQVETLDQFWQMLLSKQDQVKTAAGRGDHQAGFLDEAVSRFDHRYFNIAEAEAQTMDPQQILALELVELLWQDAGIDLERLNRRRVGVYIGAWNQEYRGHRESVYFPTGTNPSIIAARISYHYDLRGPSWVSNTACSSSLVAIHYAAKDIEAGRVDYAIAGGVNMILDRRFTDSMRGSGFLSKVDRCKTFDDSADGYVRAEGGGLVLLANKALSPSFYAELAGSAVNQNGGRAQVMTAPHPEAQQEVILEACNDAAIEPQQIAFVECHGTGTKIGDPIEISAIQQTVARNRQGTCLLGSVKSNLGHLESAAGIAGLIKSVLILNRGTVTPNLHFNKPNTFVDFDGYGLRVVTEPTAIDQQAYIGISSFGFGGTNAHLIVRGAGDAHRKRIADLKVPFDRQRATPLNVYYSPQAPETGPTAQPRPTGDSNSAKRDGASAEPAALSSAITREEVRQLIEELFFKLTNIEGIDPDVELTEQGLNSLSVTELVAQLESTLSIEVDPYIVFDYPLVEQLVDQICELVQAK